MKKETRGRKKLENPSIPVSWRIKDPVHQLLMKEQERIRKDIGTTIPLSEIFEGLVLKTLK